MLYDAWWGGEQGPRHSNEDSMLTAELKFTSPAMRDKVVHLFAVIDGHGGAGCSSWLASTLEGHVRASPAWKLDGIPLGDRLRFALKFAIERAEAQFLEVAAAEGDKSGACLVISLFCEGHICVVSFASTLSL
jgi:serine/threonine protein phosphatase PrpC